MKNYPFVVLVLFSTFVFGCSEKNNSDSKLQDSPKPTASSTTNSSQLLDKQIDISEQKTGKIFQKIPQPQISGTGVQFDKTSNPKNLNKSQIHISGQPRNSMAISGSHHKISGRLTPPHFSGQ